MIRQQLLWRNFHPARAISLAVVLAVHVLAFVFITLPSAPFHVRLQRTGSAPRSAVQVRLIDKSEPDESAASFPQPMVLPQRRVSRKKKPPTRQLAPMPKRQAPVHALIRHLPSGAWRNHRPSPRVERGVGAPRARQRLRLPGGGHVAGAPRLHLIDARSQGMAGVVRALASMAGAVDPACVKVDSWRAMSVQDLARQGVSPDALEHTAEQHACVPPQRTHGLPPGAISGPW